MRTLPRYRTTRTKFNVTWMQCETDRTTQAERDNKTTKLISPCTYTTPNTTVALKLTSFPAGRMPEAGRPSASTSRYSSVLNELDFQPQLWLTANTSGALVNLVKLAPVALAHAIVKYALTCGRGSRYGCCGATGGAVAGSETLDGPTLTREPMLPDDACNVDDGRPNADGPGSSEDETVLVAVGVDGVEEDPTVRDVRASGDEDDDGVLNARLPADGGRGLETDAEGPRPNTPLSRGGGGTAATGAEDGGMGSTVDWRCK